MQHTDDTLVAALGALAHLPWQIERFAEPDAPAVLLVATLSRVILAIEVPRRARHQEPVVFWQIALGTTAMVARGAAPSLEAAAAAICDALHAFIAPIQSVLEER